MILWGSTSSEYEQDIARWLEDSLGEVRGTALRTLAAPRCGDEVAVPLLLDALEDEDWTVQGAAIEMLSSMVPRQRRPCQC